MDAGKSQRSVNLDELLDGFASDGRRDGDPGLPVQPTEPQGGVGDADLQLGQSEREHSPVRAKSGQGSGRGRPKARGADASGERWNLPAGGSSSRAVFGEKPGSSVCSPGVVVGAELPDLQNGHWRAPEYPIAEVAEDGLRDEPTSVEDKPNERLTRLVGKSLRKLEQILDIEPSPWDDDYIKLLAMQKDAATSVIGMSIKADESRFRVQSESAIVAILQEVRALKAPTQPAIEIQAASS